MDSKGDVFFYYLFIEDLERNILRFVNENVKIVGCELMGCGGIEEKTCG